PQPQNEIQGTTKLLERMNRTGFFTMVFDNTGDHVIVTINQAHGVPQPGPSNALSWAKQVTSEEAVSGSILIGGVDLLQGMQLQQGIMGSFGNSTKGAGSEFCGDGICSTNESCSSCSTDCGPCFVCGDGICAPEEVGFCYNDCHCGDNF